MLKKHLWLIILAGVSLLGMKLGPVFAQTIVSDPGKNNTLQLIITWRAQSYVPLDYPGKILPSPNSFVVSSCELLENGKLVDLKKETIYWYLNNELLRGGRGVKDVIWETPQTAGSQVTLRAELPNFQGRTSVIKSLTIPVASPKTVLDAPAPGGSFNQKRLVVNLIPYFYNISDVNELEITWDINGQAPVSSENPRELVVNIPDGAADGFGLNINATAKNRSNIFDSSNASISLRYKK